jgi:hypothetical protein
VRIGWARKSELGLVELFQRWCVRALDLVDGGENAGPGTASVMVWEADSPYPGLGQTHGLSPIDGIKIPPQRDRLASAGRNTGVSSPK